MPGQRFTGNTFHDRLQLMLMTVQLLSVVLKQICQKRMMVVGPIVPVGSTSHAGAMMAMTVIHSDECYLYEVCSRACEVSA